jgi:hypothetical protein
MGEGKRNALRVDFDCQIRLEFHGANITSDAGLLAYRELDEALGLTTDVDELSIHDPRTGQNTQHSVTGMVRQSVYSRLAGYEDTNDAERLCVDPASESSSQEAGRVLRLLRVPGCLLDQAATSCGEGRMASRRTVSPLGLHRHEPDLVGR